jgi:thymidine kinase
VGIYPGNMQDMYAEVAGRDAELVLIDEAQFFGEDLYYYVNHIAVDYNASVVIAALSGDTNREPWPAVSKLIPYVDEVIKFNAVCQNPKCPHHSIDIGTFSAYDGIKKDKVLIGDETETETGKYIVLCRDCYEELRRKQTYV